MMNRTTKAAMALTLAGAIAVAAATPSFARGGRIAAGVIGFAAGTMLGAAAASANNGYYNGGAYAYEPGYQPGYAYEPGYAYGPAPRSSYTYGAYDRSGCVAEGPQGIPDYSPCQ